MADKLLKYDVAMKSTKTVWQMETPICYTGDENTVTFDFNIIDLEEADLVGVIPNVYLYMRDGSFFQKGPADGVEITGTTVNYTMKGNEGKHSGIAKAQLVLVWDDEVNPPEKLTSQMYAFEVVSGLENKVAVEVMIQDWTTLTREARTFIDTSADEVDALKGELQTAITTANTSLGEFDVALETGIVAANLAEKLEDFESTNNSRLLSAERQLEQTNILSAEAVAKADAMASGSPKGIYTTLALLQAAYPTGTTGAYLVSADGNWYYWSGSAWTIGGVYQSTGLSSASVSRDILSKNFNMNATIVAGTDLNTVSSDGIYFGSANGNYLNIPSTYETGRNFILRVTKYFGTRFHLQEFWQENNTYMYFSRIIDTSGAGGVWIRQNLPLAASITATELANNAVTVNKILDKNISNAKLADTYSYNGSLTTGDANTLTRTGVHLVTGQLSNMPAGAAVSGYLKVENYNNGSFIVQEYIELNTYKKSYRRTIRPANSIFNPWEDISVPTNTNPYAGKTLVYFGDSVIEFGTIPSELAAKLGMTVYNVGFGGTRMAKHEDNSQGVLYNEMCMFRLANYVNTGVYTGLIQAASDLSALGSDNNIAIAERLAGIDFNAVDYVIISYGTNDFASGFDMPIGLNTDITADGSTFKGAINYTIQQLQTAYPHLKIIFTTPIYRTRYYLGDGLNSDDNPNIYGKYLKEFNDAIKEVSKLNHIPVIDLHDESGINEYTAPLYISTDGLHPSADGYTHLAGKVASSFSAQFM